MAKVLIVDDEKDIADIISDLISEEGYETLKASDSDKAIKLINTYLPSLVILDIWLQGSELDGLGVLEYIKSRYSNMPVIMISGHGSIENAVNSIKMGAYDYIEKPFNADKLLAIFRRAINMHKLHKENIILRQKIAPEVNNITGISPAANQLRSIISKVAGTPSRVMISGQPGSGKELIAKLIHKKSGRVGDFVTMSSPNLNLDEIEDELFGKIDQSGRKKIGLIEKAHRGTLFIDEISDMPLKVQNRLLQFLHTQTFRHHENGELVKADVRIISSTTRSLERASSNLKDELFYRLNVVPIETIPLSARKEDIPYLCEEFIKELVRANPSFKHKELSKELIVKLQLYSWPGNIRELRNVIEWLLIMSNDDGDIITHNILPTQFSIQEKQQSLIANDILTKSIKEAREEFEYNYIKTHLERFDGNISKTANFIKMERAALHRKMKNLSIKV